MLIVAAKSDEGDCHAQLGEIHRHVARPARAVLEPGDIDYRDRRLGLTRRLAPLQSGRA